MAYFTGIRRTPEVKALYQIQAPEESHMGSLKIFLVEDNYGDERLIKEALQESACGSSLEVTRDGVDALAYLRQAPHPDIIFLDINIPKKSGLEVLAEIKSTPELNSIPVLVLTTSDSMVDREQCLALKADGYIRKPVDLHEFLKLIIATEEDWIKRIAGQESTRRAG
jgi:two-component system, chemotaxis family, response regulator Rcp1